MTATQAQTLVEEATLAFTLGESEEALSILQKVLDTHPENFAALHARAEILFAEGDFARALEAAKAAVQQNPEDIHIHTSLSRIYMRLGEIQTAEKHGAEARRLGWKETLKESPPA